MANDIKKTNASIKWIQDGEEVTASVTNRPVKQVNQNYEDLYSAVNQVLQDNNGTIEIRGGTKVAGNFVIDGELTITGDTTKIQTTDTEVKDNIVVLNAGETGSGVTKGTAGIEIDRGSLKPAKLIFDELNDKWKLDYGDGVYHTLVDETLNTLDSNTLLSKLKNVDGIGSGLDADLWRGKTIGQIGVYDGLTTITVSNTTEFLDAINTVNRKKFLSPVIIELEDGTYTFNETIHLRNLGEWDYWLIIRSQSQDKTKVTITMDFNGVLFECYNNVYIRFENLTFDGGLDFSDKNQDWVNSNVREFIQLHNKSVFASWNSDCEVKNMSYAISAFEHSRVHCDGWVFTECLSPIRVFTNSVMWAIGITATLTSNHDVYSCGVNTFDNSFCDCSNSTISGFINGIAADAQSRIHCSNTTVSNFGDSGILALHNSYVYASPVTVDGQGRGKWCLRADSCGLIESAGSTLKNAEYAMSAINNSTIRGWNNTSEGISTHAVEADNFSYINAENFNVTSDNADANSTNASIIRASGSNLSTISNNENSWTNDGIIIK